jgi:DNA-binding HxlR family transcriptional regulator
MAMWLTDQGASVASPTASAGPAGPCPVAMPAEHTDFIREVLDRVGDKWVLLVIATLQNRTWRYSELRNAIQGISPRMLAVALRQLVQDGLATRTAYPEVPPRVEYALTPLGTSLLDVVCSLVGWAAAHHEEISEHRARSGLTVPVER